MHFFIPIPYRTRSMYQEKEDNRTRKEGENTLTRFGDGCIRGGWLGLLVGVTLITGTEYAAQMDFTTLMPALAVSLLSPLYGYFFKLITLQLD